MYGTATAGSFIGMHPKGQCPPAFSHNEYRQWVSHTGMRYEFRLPYLQQSAHEARVGMGEKPPQWNKTVTVVART